MNDERLFVGATLHCCSLEVLGRYSNHADLGELFQGLIEMASSGRPKPKTRTNKQIHRRLRPDEMNDVVVGYQGGLTLYQLAQRFQIHLWVPKSHPDPLTRTILPSDVTRACRTSVR